MRNDFTAIVEQREGWFIAYSPEVRGAYGQGRTKDEAMQNLIDDVILTRRRRRGLMIITEVILFGLTLGLGVFSWWGLNTKAGREEYDEMGAMAPGAAGFVAFLVGIIGVALLIRSRYLKKVASRPQMACPSCGYDMRATPERCPECGTLREPLR